MDSKKIISFVNRIVVPAAIFGIVWYVTLPILRYTILLQEQKGLFLFTPDYFRQTFANPWPITRLISDFLVQFYQNAGTGAAIIAGIVTAEYLLVCSIFRLPSSGKRFGVHSFRQIFGAAAALGTWCLIAHSPSLHPAVIVLVFTDIAALIFAFILRNAPKPEASCWWQGAVAILFVICGAAHIISNKKIREEERWYAVEYLVRCHDWDVTLAIATPQVCIEDISFVPYALLALNAKGQLGERLYDYPITGEESFGDICDGTWSSCSLNSVIYETIGCPNEAIHMAFQMGMGMDHGTSLGLLRQLIRLEIENGDYALAIKYAEILGRSPANRKIAANAIKMAKDAAKAAGKAGSDDEDGAVAGTDGEKTAKAGDVAGAVQTATDTGKTGANGDKTEEAGSNGATANTETGKAEAEGVDPREAIRVKDIMISNNPRYNLGGIIMNSPSVTDAAVERLLCHLLVSGDTDAFRNALAEFYGSADPDDLPKYFRTGK